MRIAGQADVPNLVDLMADFYSEAGLALDRGGAAAAFTALLDDPRMGYVWLVERGADIAGYVLVTVVFAMEYGGPVAVVDDFYVRPAFRGVGLGTAALAEVCRACASFGMRGMRVEVGRDNLLAQAVYRSAGFAAVDHQLMTLRLSAPLHTE
jgi:GNAT superfamily N-acetyltransferase